MKTVTATEAKNNFGELMSLAEAGPVSITRNGRVVATLLPATRQENALPGSDAIDEILAMYSKGLIDRHDVQDETGLSFGEILQRMRQSGMTLPIVRTFDRFNDRQKALYNEIFSAS